MKENNHPKFTVKWADAQIDMDKVVKKAQAIVTRYARNNLTYKLKNELNAKSQKFIGRRLLVYQDRRISTSTVTDSFAQAVLAGFANVDDNVLRKLQQCQKDGEKIIEISDTPNGLFFKTCRLETEKEYTERRRKFLVDRECRKLLYPKQNGAKNTNSLENDMRRCIQTYGKKKVIEILTKLQNE